jgi:cyclohexyl-isocyanide hydratase
MSFEPYPMPDMNVASMSAKTWPMAKRDFIVVFTLFPGGLALDFIGPHMVFSRLPGARVLLASTRGGEIQGEGGVTIGGLHRLADIAACDIICVPGGRGIDDVMLDEAFLREVRRLAARARFVTSVCTGALALGAAGLLRGKRAATHWHAREFLAAFGATADPGRVVYDGNVITSGGVTAGIDFALSIAAKLAGPNAAQEIQLQIEYAPAPPFNAGTPETAPPDILARVRDHYSASIKRRRAAVEAAVDRLSRPVSA